SAERAVRLVELARRIRPPRAGTGADEAAGGGGRGRPAGRRARRLLLEQGELLRRGRDGRGRRDRLGDPPGPRAGAADAVPSGQLADLARDAVLVGLRGVGAPPVQVEIPADEPGVLLAQPAEEPLARARAQMQD